MREDYRFADFEQNPDLLKDLQQLEQKIEQQLGRTVNLIAFTPDSNAAESTLKQQDDESDT